MTCLTYVNLIPHRAPVLPFNLYLTEVNFGMPNVKSLTRRLALFWEGVCLCIFLLQLQFFKEHYLNFVPVCLNISEIWSLIPLRRKLKIFYSSSSYSDTLPCCAHFQLAFWSVSSMTPLSIVQPAGLWLTGTSYDPWLSVISRVLVPMCISPSPQCTCRFPA